MRRPETLIRRGALAGLLVGLAACSTVTTLSQPSAVAPSKDARCAVEIFPARQSRPTRPYTVVTKAESHIERNFFFGGTASLDDDAYGELRAQACKVGADAVLVDDVIQSDAGEFSHIHLWATLVRFEP